MLLVANINQSIYNSSHSFEEDRESLDLKHRRE